MVLVPLGRSGDVVLLRLLLGFFDGIVRLGSDVGDAGGGLQSSLQQRRTFPFLRSDVVALELLNEERSVKARAQQIGCLLYTSDAADE